MVLRIDILKLCSVVSCNLTHKAAKIPHVKLDIRKPCNNKSPTFSPNVIGSLCLDAQRQASPTNIRKPSRSVTKLSHSKVRNSARQKLHHRLCYKSNHIWCKYHVKNFCFYLHTYVNFCFYSYFWGITLILFVVIINKFIL